MNMSGLQQKKIVRSHKENALSHFTKHTHNNSSKNHANTR